MNYVLIAVIAVLAVFGFVGYKKGLLRMLIGIAAMALALMGSYYFSPMVKSFIVDHTKLSTSISDGVKNYLDEQIQGGVAAAKEQVTIDTLKLPDNIEELLVKNNNVENYAAMGVNSFEDYVGAFVADLAVSALSYILVFLFIYIVLRILCVVLKVVSYLPVIKGINKLAGAAVGLAQALVYIWIFFTIATAAVNTGWGMYVIQSIAASPVLTFIYKYNFVMIALASMIG